jgi:hypothetical protein
MPGSDQKSASAATTGSPSPHDGTLGRLNEQVKLGHQAWVERLQEMQAVEEEFAKELLAARDPAEALRVCNRWIGKRLELLSADSKAFAGFWMDLVVTASGTRRPGNAPAKGDDA